MCNFMGTFEPHFGHFDSNSRLNSYKIGLLIKNVLSCIEKKRKKRRKKKKKKRKKRKEKRRKKKKKKEKKRRIRTYCLYLIDE